MTVDVTLPLPPPLAARYLAEAILRLRASDDVEGHPFHGNQWTQGGAPSETAHIVHAGERYNFNKVGTRRFLFDSKTGTMVYGRKGYEVEYDEAPGQEQSHADALTDALGLRRNAPLHVQGTPDANYDAYDIRGRIDATSGTPHIEVFGNYHYLDDRPGLLDATTRLVEHALANGAKASTAVNGDIGVGEERNHYGTTIRETWPDKFAQHRAAGDKPGHDFHGNQWTKSLVAKLKRIDTVYGMPRADFDPGDPAFSFKNQASQFPAKGKPGIGYFKGVLSKNLHVDNLLYRDTDGTILGLLHHFPKDIPPYEAKGNITVQVDPAHQGKGIATALLKEADKRWNINFAQQTYTDQGHAFVAHLVEQAKKGKLRALGDVVGHPFHGNQYTGGYGKWVNPFGENEYTKADEHGTHIRPHGEPESYDELLDRIRSTSVAFHGTSEEAWAHIQQEGLVPHRGKGGDELSGAPAYVFAGKRGASVYMTTSATTAGRFAELVARRNHADPVVLEIHVPLANIGKIKLDEHAPLSMEGVRFEGTIPPEWIHRTSVPAVRRAPLFSGDRQLAERPTIIYGVLPVDAASRTAGDVEGHPFHGNQWTAGSVKKTRITQPSGYQFDIRLKKMSDTRFAMYRKEVGKDTWEHASDVHVLPANRIQSQGLTSAESDAAWKLLLEFGAVRMMGYEGRTLGDLPGHDFHGNQWTGGFGEFVRQALANMRRTSRTSTGVSDTSSSPDKPKLTVEGQDLSARTEANTRDALAYAWSQKDAPIASAADVAHVVTTIANRVNAGLVQPGQSPLRTWETVFPSTPAARVPEELNGFYRDLAARLSPGFDPVKTAAWAEKEFDGRIHPLADGVGRTTKVMSAWILARGGHQLPTYPASLDTYYGDMRGDNWEQRYRSYFGPRAAGDKPGHDFHGNQWTGSFGFPPASDDPAPGSRYMYHSTPVERLRSIAEQGLTRPGSQNPISLAPHMHSVRQWGSMIGAKDMAVLRTPRAGLRLEEHPEEHEYDRHDESAEDATYQPIGAHRLEVYHDGTWKPIAALKTLGDVEGHPFHGNQYTSVAGSLPRYKGQAALDALKRTLPRVHGSFRSRFILPDGTRLGFHTESDGTHWDNARMSGVALYDALAAGAVRSSSPGAVQVGAPLTDEQARLIVEDAREHDTSLYVDGPSASKEFPRPSAAGVKLWVDEVIRRYDERTNRSTPRAAGDKLGHEFHGNQYTDHRVANYRGIKQVSFTPQDRWTESDAAANKAIIDDVLLRVPPEAINGLEALYVSGGGDFLGTASYSPVHENPRRYVSDQIGLYDGWLAKSADDKKLVLAEEIGHRYGLTVRPDLVKAFEHEVKPTVEHLKAFEPQHWQNYLKHRTPAEQRERVTGEVFASSFAHHVLGRTTQFPALDAFWQRTLGAPKTLGDVVGHPFHGNQWTGGRGAYGIGHIRSRKNPLADMARQRDEVASMIKRAKEQGNRAQLPDASPEEVAKQQALADAQTNPLAHPDFVLGLPDMANPKAFERYIAAYGQAYSGAVRPSDIPKMPDKQCYRNASMLVMDHPDYDYVEGFAKSERTGDLVFMHAWALDRKTGQVVDATWRDPEKSQYFGVRYDRAAYLKYLYKAKVYGVLGSTEKNAAKAVATGGNGLRALGDKEGHPFHGNQWTTLPGTLYRGTKKGTFNETSTDFIGGELGGGTYFTPHLDAAIGYGGSGEASKFGQHEETALHEVTWARQPQPHEVGHVTGSAADGHARIIDEHGAIVWQQSEPMTDANYRAQRAEMLAAAQGHGVKVLIGEESHEGAGQVSVLDKSILKHVSTRRVDQYKGGSRVLGDVEGHPFHGNQWTGGLSARAHRALATHKPATREKQRQAAKDVALVARLTGGTVTKRGAPMDVIVHTPRGPIGVEVKSLFDTTRDAITMHPDALVRKHAWAEENKALARHTVIVDHRGGRTARYHREGFGSFTFNSDHKIGLEDIRRVVTGKRAA